MKTFCILSALVASAAAFAPNAHQATSTALKAADFKSEVGAQMPLGFWDPMNMVGSGDQGRFDRLREVEVKHGRIAMLAVTGYLTTYAGVRLDGMESMPSGFAALSPSAWAENPVAKSQIYGTVIFIALMEFCVMKDHLGTAEFPGDYRNGGFDLGWDKFDEKTKLRKRAIELNNGRAAQMGILGLMVHEKMGNVATILPLAK
eukprot:CAMPEP_0172361298 /NCGR_PEP_ID=MMETSP1060-20121228/5154_1 /TAXON_ID=37318 /ORGANISM="Pseudo-nitzschia pungens, Strain cf. cingulata" /LENGTH=202 /DNA_ID=CAMNT_0013083521 /DNA_START=116 /DNA_END=724 /DNA_ORIENTATION=-